VLFEVIDRGIELHDRRAAGDGPDDASRLTDRLG
jgi:hypothetical protein